LGRPYPLAQPERVNGKGLSHQDSQQDSPVVKIKYCPQAYLLLV